MTPRKPPASRTTDAPVTMEALRRQYGSGPVQQTYERLDPKHVYYLSMEFLIGRSLTNNITNMLLDPFVGDFVRQASLERCPDGTRRP